VFPGGCTLQGAEAVCHADLDTLQSLVEESLLRRTGDRFWMLETIREYAAERLEEDEERDHLRRRLAHHLLELAEAARGHLRGPEQEAWFRRLRSEQDNLRAALGWAVERGEAEVGLRLAAALQVFWRRRGQHEEAAHWFERLLALEPVPPPRVRARALAAGGHFAALTGNLDLAERRFAESIPALRRLGDEAGLAEALRGAPPSSPPNGVTTTGPAGRPRRLGLAAVAARRGEPERAGRLWGAGEALAERLGMRVDPEARARYEGALEAGRAMGAEPPAADVLDDD